MYQQQRWGIIARQYVAGKIRTIKPIQYASLVFEYINSEWEKMTLQEKEKYEQLATQFFVSGYELFVKETMKQLFGTKYNQGIYGSTRYGR